MNRHVIPKEIHDILVKAHDGKEPTQSEKDKVATYIGTLEQSVHHPVTGKEIPNPHPVQVDVSLRKPESLEERVRRIMSISHRMAELNGQFESPEEADDFDVDDVFDSPIPPSPFAMMDHYTTMVDEQPGPPADPPTPPPAEEPAESIPEGDPV